jgi:hypothetical protein
MHQSPANGFKRLDEWFASFGKTSDAKHLKPQPRELV